MAEIFLVRHAQSYANKRDFTAFGNIESPLTERGIAQAVALKGLFKEVIGVFPEEYEWPVLASTYTRPQETAKHAGFRNIHTDPIINESDVDREIMSGLDVIKKHCREHWAPPEVQKRAQRFIGLVREGELGYEIYFTHGMFIASVLLELDGGAEATTYAFDAKRGYVPLQATITQVEL